MVRKFFTACLTTALLTLLPACVGAQSFPNRPVHLVVPFSAGGPVDLLSRTLAVKLSDVLGQPVIVDNRPGAGGGIAAAYTAKAAPDGYTIMLITAGTQTINPALYPKLGYDPLKDFTYVTTVGLYSLVLLANPNLEAKTLPEFIALARSRPNAFSYGSAGVGSSGHLAAELFKSTAGLQMQHIPYKGSAESLTGVMNGDLAFVFDLVSTALPQIKAGRVRALGWSGVRRSSLIPDVPIIAEAGFPGFEITGWVGIGAPAGLQKSVLDRLHESLAQAINSPETREKLLSQGYEISLIAPDAFTALVKSDFAKWAKVVRDSGAKLE